MDGPKSLRPPVAAGLSDGLSAVSSRCLAAVLVSLLVFFAATGAPQVLRLVGRDSATVTPAAG